MVNWEPVVMAGIGAAAAQIDPSLDLYVLILLCLRAFVGAAVGAYFGNHLSARRRKNKG